jgi:hypothetical protein
LFPGLKPAEDAKGDKVATVRLLGPTAISTRRKYARLLSHNGIENYGFDKEGNEIFLDNEIRTKRVVIIFDSSDRQKRVEVPVVRHNGGAFLKMRPPTSEEL